MSYFGDMLDDKHAGGGWQRLDSYYERDRRQATTVALSLLDAVLAKHSEGYHFLIMAKSETNSVVELRWPGEGRLAEDRDDDSPVQGKRTSDSSSESEAGFKGFSFGIEYRYSSVSGDTPCLLPRPIQMNFNGLEDLLIQYKGVGELLGACGAKTPGGRGMLSQDEEVITAQKKTRFGPSLEAHPAEGSTSTAPTTTTSDFCKLTDAFTQPLHRAVVNGGRQQLLMLRFVLSICAMAVLLALAVILWGHSMTTAQMLAVWPVVAMLGYAIIYLLIIISHTKTEVIVAQKAERPDLLKMLTLAKEGGRIGPAEFEKILDSNDTVLSPGQTTSQNQYALGHARISARAARAFGESLSPPSLTRKDTKE